MSVKTLGWDQDDVTNSITPYESIIYTSQIMQMISGNGVNFESWTCLRFIKFT